MILLLYTIIGVALGFVPRPFTRAPPCSVRGQRETPPVSAPSGARMGTKNRAAEADTMVPDGGDYRSKPSD